jgi:hypothetical protein
MPPHTRAFVAASAHAVLSSKKVAGLYDHAAGRHLRIAAECRNDRVQAFDGESGVRFGGTLPDLFDEGDEVFISLQVNGTTARGYDRGSATFFEVRVTDQLAQLYDHGESTWFAFDVQFAEPA